MPRKTAKQIVDEVIAKVEEETTPRVSNKSKAAPKEEAPKPVEHLRQCMVNVVPGSACNCPASLA